MIVSPTLQSEVVIYCQPNPPKLELKHERSTWKIAKSIGKNIPFKFEHFFNRRRKSEFEHFCRARDRDRE